MAKKGEPEAKEIQIRFRFSLSSQNLIEPKIVEVSMKAPILLVVTLKRPL